MKKLPLTQGKFALVDDEDYKWLSQWKWKLNWNGYVCRNARVDGRYKKTYIHRLINKTPTGLDTDHINRDKLDNQRHNLRSVTRSVNNFHMLPSKANKSGVKGVCWSPRGHWRAYIRHEGKQVFLGNYHIKSEAISARLMAEKKLICV